jgi:pimeloyl-ACP methyl ester carboxylesterase
MSNTTTIDGHELVYTTAGRPKAPPLITVHGWTSYHGVRRQTIEAFNGYLVEQHVPDSRMVLIDRCGHFAMHERLQQYLDTLRAFLQKSL